MSSAEFTSSGLNYVQLFARDFLTFSLHSWQRFEARYRLTEKVRFVKEFIDSHPLLKWVLAGCFCSNLIPLLCFVGFLSITFSICLILFLCIEGFFICVSMIIFVFSTLIISTVTAIGVCTMYCWWFLVDKVYRGIVNSQMGIKSQPPTKNETLHAANSYSDHVD